MTQQTDMFSTWDQQALVPEVNREEPEPTPEQARDAGIEQVTDNNLPWVDRAFHAASRLPAGEYTGEDIRLAIADDAGEPKHPNAWGALVNRLVRSDHLEATGQYRKPKSTKSHARKIQVYRKDT